MEKNGPEYVIIAVISALTETAKYRQLMALIVMAMEGHDVWAK